MDKRDFDYDLPAACIAQQPLARRSDSRLLHLPRGAEAGLDEAGVDRRVTDLPSLLDPRDLLVFNDTRVIPARLYGRKATGGEIEVMLERILDARRLSARVRANKAPVAGSRIEIGEFVLEVEARSGEFYTLTMDDDASVASLLDRHGHVPLPPYIRRADAAADRERYQTLWARHEGAVAAPTAGLHFDQPLLDAIGARGVQSATTTLHVGSGTYQRLREGELAGQCLHSERVRVGPAAVERIGEAKARGGRVIAVGTTVVRSLESAARAPEADGRLAPFEGETELFLKPGDCFRVVDAMVTNFHEPQSSLLMLVCAFAGRERILAAYAHAREQGYRFLSYGDAMFIE